MVCQFIAFLTFVFILNIISSIIYRLNYLECGNKLSNDTWNDKLPEDVNLLKSEVLQLKDLLLKLQSFTMKTNQKLLEGLIHEEEDSIDELINVNLKELIQKEKDLDLNE